MRKRAEGEEGYALVAAVASILVFSLIALMTIEANRATIVSTGAEMDRAQAQAAADAGGALAIAGFLSTDPTGRWAIDGRVRRERFGSASLAIKVEDERGKIPLNALEDEQARTLLAALGLSGDRLDIATDSFLDWIDEDDDERTNGAEAAFYQRAGIRPRNGPLRSIAEIARIRGFDGALAARLEEVATVHFGSGSFEPRHASPIAITVMLGEEGGAAAVIDRQREIAGQRTALSLDGGESLVGRPLTILVDAKLDNGAHARKRQLVILTGSPASPYVVRESE